MSQMSLDEAAMEEEVKKRLEEEVLIHDRLERMEQRK